MVNLVSLGGQHQGVYGLPHCPGKSWMLCDLMRRLLNLGAYTKWIQKFLIQAQYWHNPMDEALYKRSSIFLADLNQENVIKKEYKDNLMKLKNFVMVMFAQDRYVLFSS